MSKKFGLSILLTVFLSLGFSQLMMASSTSAVSDQQLCLDFCDAVYENCRLKGGDRNTCYWEKFSCLYLCGPY